MATAIRLVGSAACILIGCCLLPDNIATAAPFPLLFVPVAPCRVIDTRPNSGLSGPFGGPHIPAGTTRDFPIPASTCEIPAGAQAYSFNVTVAPPGPLRFLSIWPTGYAQPNVSTLNSFGGQVVA